MDGSFTLCLTNYGPVLVLFFLCKVYVILRTVLFEPLLFTARKRSLGQGNIFTPVCHSVHRGGGMCGCSRGGMHGCSWGGHAWLLLGGHAWLLRGGMRGCSGGACVVAPGGHAWLLPGGACVVAPKGGHAWDTTTHRDTVNERAVSILLECILVWFVILFYYLLHDLEITISEI